MIRFIRLCPWVYILNEWENKISIFSGKLNKNLNSVSLYIIIYMYVKSNLPKISLAFVFPMTMPIYASDRFQTFR